MEQSKSPKGLAYHSTHLFIIGLGKQLSGKHSVP